MIICITGIDGCGKGTQINLLANFLRKKNYDVFISKAYGEKEKKLLSSFIESLHPISMMFLFQALHTQQRINTEKALEKNKIIIADRWDESYLAYHSNYGILKDNPQLREELNRIAFNNIIPDVTFLLRLSVSVARSRCQIRGADFFDRLSSEYHKTMQNAYLKIAKERHWIILNGAKPELTIHKEIIRHLLRIRMRI